MRPKQDSFRVSRIRNSQARPWLSASKVGCGIVVVASVILGMLVYFLWESPVPYTVNILVPPTFSGSVTLRLPPMADVERRRCFVPKIIDLDVGTPQGSEVELEWPIGAIDNQWIQTFAVEPGGKRLRQAVLADPDNSPNARYVWVVQMDTRPGGNIRYFVGAEAEYSSFLAKQPIMFDMPPFNRFR